MVRPLRQRHRVMIFALTITLPAAFALGVATRKEVPSSRLTSSGLFAQAQSPTELWSRDNLWEKKAIKTRLLTMGPTQLAVELMPMDRIARPDVLVYWVPQGTRFQDSLPDDAFLLGSFEQPTPVPLILPEIATRQTGVLVLYSLADHEMLAVSKGFALK